MKRLTFCAGERCAIRAKCELHTLNQEVTAIARGLELRAGEVVIADFSPSPGKPCQRFRPKIDWKHVRGVRPGEA